MSLGIVVFGHGSSVPSANEAVRAVAARMAEEGGLPLVEAGFLELGKPDLPGAVDRLVERGATRILVVPYFLTLGIHLQRDLPRIVEGISRIHQGMEIRVTPPLDGHPALSAILVERAREADA
ncbi:MAG: CbiX/SirB N-terminal domain-containing protein [Bryobacterales bacterium]|jgi:sirohydrochlorin ferrochelatase|nr:CbiX/SirB N-terminal domain-containing protein [Bryobacterales bacterium]